MKGTYKHTLDLKGRVIIPAKLQEELGEHFTITRGVDNCLFVYPEAGWNKLEEKILAQPMKEGRKLQRFFLSSASDAVADKQGRVLIPSVLREYARLEKDVTIIGVGDRAEIWDSAWFEEYNAQNTNDDIIAAMDELGF